MERSELEKFKRALHNNGKPVGEIMEIIYRDLSGKRRSFIPWIKVSSELYSEEEMDEEGDTEEEDAEEEEASADTRIPLYNCWN